MCSAISSSPLAGNLLVLSHYHNIASFSMHHMYILARCGARLPVLCVQTRPVQEFWEDFEQQEKVFKEKVAEANERNAERKVSFRCTMHTYVVL